MVNNQRTLISRLLSRHPTIQYGTSTKYTSITQESLHGIVFPRQVHGDGIAWIDESNSRVQTIADGLLTRSRNIAIGIRTADCVPVLLYEPIAEIAGVVHAGWRGAVKQIVGHAVAEIVSSGGNAGNIIASIGPHIKSCCYEVGRDVASLFEGLSDSLVSRNGSKVVVNLAGAVSKQLIDSGVRQSNIEESTHCTYCEKEMFVSYRRDGPQSYNNQIISYISLK